MLLSLMEVFEDCLRLFSRLQGRDNYVEPWVRSAGLWIFSIIDADNLDANKSHPIFMFQQLGEVTIRI